MCTPISISGTYMVPGTTVSEHLTIFNGVILTTPLWDRKCYYPHLAEGILNTKRLSDLLKVTEEVWGRAGNWTQSLESLTSALITASSLPLIYNEHFSQCPSMLFRSSQRIDFLQFGLMLLHFTHFSRCALKFKWLQRETTISHQYHRTQGAVEVPAVRGGSG